MTLRIAPDHDKPLSGAACTLTIRIGVPELRNWSDEQREAFFKGFNMMLSATLAAQPADTGGGE